MGAAGQAAIALGNAQLYGAATARGKRSRPSRSSRKTLTASFALGDVLNRVVDSAVSYSLGVARRSGWSTRIGGVFPSAPTPDEPRIGSPDSNWVRVDGRIVADRTSCGAGSAVTSVNIDASTPAVISFAGVP
jgi:hypothetical protein